MSERLGATTVIAPEDMLFFESQFEVQAPDLEAERRVRLESLPHSGFDNAGHRYQEMVEQIAAIGFPVDNFRSFHRRPNDKGDQYTLASWMPSLGTDGVYYAHEYSPRYGEYSVHELLDSQIPEERLATYGHECAHANTPLDPENAALFGGEVERQEAETFVRQAANQSLLTDKMLNGYHRLLAEQYKKKEISLEIFTEETQAILSELALTNRAKIEQIQTEQLKKLDDINRRRHIQRLPAIKPVKLISNSEQTAAAKRAGNDSIQAEGIDKNLIKLLAGVTDHESLLTHVDKLKQRFYAPKTYQVARERRIAHYSQPVMPPAEIIRQSSADRMMRHMFDMMMLEMAEEAQHDERAESEAKDKKKKKKAKA